MKTGIIRITIGVCCIDCTSLENGFFIIDKYIESRTSIIIAARRSNDTENMFIL